MTSRSTSATRCAGIWFDARELDRVLGQKSVDALRRLHEPRADLDGAAAAAPAAAAAAIVRVASTTGANPHRHCPVCGGQWLDGGELAILRREGFSGSMKRLFSWILDLG